MKKAVQAKVSPRGFTTTIIFDDGSISKVNFQNFLKAFGDWRKAVYEYATYVWVKVNKKELGDKAVDEIFSRLL